MNQNKHYALEQLKIEKGLHNAQKALPSFELPISASVWERLRYLSGNFVEALMKMAYHTLRGTQSFPTLEELGFSKQKAQLLHMNLPQSHREMMVIGRLDVTTDGERYYTYECNGSQPGGMEFVELFAHPWFADAEAAAQIEQLYSHYVGNALHFFQQKTSRREPTGILLLRHHYHLCNTLHAMLERHLGRKVFMSEDGSDCSWDGQRLLFLDNQGKRHSIDLIFRSPRTTLEELMEGKNATLLKAWKKGKVVIVNPPHAKIVGWKTLYVYLKRRDLWPLAELTEAEITAIEQILPEISLVDEENVARLREHKDDWVLKYTLRGRGAMVWLGPELSQQTWDERVNRAVEHPGWICQRFHAPFSLPITLHDHARSQLVVPATVDPFVTIGESLSVPSCLCRAVIPVHGDAAELKNVKLNILGENIYKDPNGVSRERCIGFGYARTNR